MQIDESTIIWDKPDVSKVVWDEPEFLELPEGATPPISTITGKPIQELPELPEPLDMEGNPFDVDAFIEEEGKNLPLYQDPKKDFSEVLYPIVRPFLATGVTTAGAINSGLGAFSTHLDILSEYIEEKTGFKSEGVFEQAAKVYEDNAEYWQNKADKIGITFLDELLGEAIGGAVPGVGEFMLNIPYFAFLGAAKAEKAGENEISGALVEGGKRGILGLIFRAIHPLKQYLRAPTMGTVFGVQVASEGGEPREIAKAFGTGALYSMSSPGGRMGLNELRKGIKSEISFRETKTRLIERFAKKPQTIAIPTEAKPEAITTEFKGEGIGEPAPKFADVVEVPQKPVERVAPLFTESQIKRRAKQKAIKQQQLQVESAEQAKEQIHSMIRERRQNLNLSAYETNLFVNSIDKITSRSQREAIPFILEGTEVPKGLNRPDLEKILTIDKEKLTPIAEQVKEHFDKGWRKIKENTPDMSAEQIENYVTHIWDIPRAKKQVVTNWFATQNRFLKKRYIETINEGIEKFGLQPKVLDISEIIRIHDGITNRVIENNKFVEQLKNLKYEGVSLIERADKAPQDWVYFDHPALRRGLVIPGKLKMGEKVSPELANLLNEMGVAIGRRISPVTFGKPTAIAGEYRAGEPPEVRFQRFMSNRTVAHEIGHHLDSVLGLGKSFLEKYKNELYEINKERIKSLIGKPGKYGEEYARTPEEQIAEFFATLFTKPKEAYEIAPNVTADVLNRLKQDGTLSKLVDFDFEKNAKNLIEEQMNTLVKLPVKVHPDLEKSLKVIFDSRIDHPAIRAYEILNGVLKKTKLSLSLFHHGALGETGVAIMGLRKTGEIYLNPVKLYKALVKGEFDIYKKEPIARDAIKHGLQVGATADIPVNMIQRHLNNFARKTKNVPLLNKTTEFIRTFNETWDRALWDYLHDTLKLYAYESLNTKIKLDKDIKKQKQEIAQFVNDTFGGQNWDTLMVTPKTLQIMTWSLLSADWTTSTIRQALSPTGIGKIHKETAGLRKKLGAHFWIKAGLYFGVGINLLNYTFRKWDEEENPQYYKGIERTFTDRTMVGNTLGHKTHLFAGRYEDGSERYIRWGKQFRELPELLFDDTGFSPISATLKKVGGKIAPVPQLISQITTGVSLSGFRNDDVYGKKGWDKVLGIGKTIMRDPLPFSSRALFREGKEFHITDLAMPSSKGMTRYKSIELFKHAIKNQDEQLLKEIYQFTLMNNLPAYTLFKAGLTSLKAESTKEYNEGVDTLTQAIEKLSETENISDLKRMERTIIRIQKEQSDRKIGMDLLEKAILDMEIYKLIEGEE